jgi:hypothetical protein
MVAMLVDDDRESEILAIKSASDADISLVPLMIVET